eukprot:2953579-Prorocentrum_lima.AAC.1
MNDQTTNEHKARHFFRVRAPSISQVLVELKEKAYFVSRAELWPVPRCCGSGRRGSGSGARWRSGGR